MTEIETKIEMTHAECEQWDEYYTKNTFEPGPNLLKQGVKPGFAHNVPAVYDSLTARIRALRSIVPKVRDQGWQTVPEQWRENGAQRNDLAGRNPGASEWVRSIYRPCEVPAFCLFF
jgi:hypothetical protein